MAMTKVSKWPDGFGLCVRGRPLGATCYASGQCSTRVCSMWLRCADMEPISDSCPDTNQPLSLHGCGSYCDTRLGSSVEGSLLEIHDDKATCCGCWVAGGDRTRCSLGVPAAGGRRGSLRPVSSAWRLPSTWPNLTRTSSSVPG